MPSDPRRPEFWSDEYRRLWDEFGPMALKLFFAGAKSGASVLPRGVDLLINWDVFNEQAIHWLKQYGLRWVGGINEVTRKGAMNVIDEWIKSGEALPMLEQRLAPLFDPGRAHRVAVTEVTRIYAEGNKQAWSSTGMVGRKRWNTAEDEKVCPICGALDGREVDLDNYFPAIEMGGIMNPPAHVNCRCWITPVVDEDMVREQIRQAINR